MQKKTLKTYRVFLVISLALIVVYLLVLAPVHATPVRLRQNVRCSYSFVTGGMARAQYPGNIGSARALVGGNPGLAATKVKPTIARNEKPGADSTWLREITELPARLHQHPRGLAVMWDALGGHLIMIVAQFCVRKSKDDTLSRPSRAPKLAEFRGHYFGCPHPVATNRCRNPWRSFGESADRTSQ